MEIIGIYLIIASILVSVIWSRMILIWRDVQMNRVNNIRNDFKRMREIYLMVCFKCGVPLIENPTFNQMYETIKRWKL